MKIEPADLIFYDGFEAYFCGAKPFGGDREHERAVDHNWEIGDDGILFCCYCGASAVMRNSPGSVQ